ncbi:MAG: STAS/SEC14 domain-containing protein [Acaryochloridaceae cyanobacterium RL_2_7]|nr:STAS/SEC14 domain-containing protein [Acaryochloridaceae cyanobacterium RL_2_7]
MIEYRNNPSSNVVELTVEGKITEADFDQVIVQLKTDIEKHGKLRLLEEIRSFEGMDLIALWKDAQFGLSHVNDFTHVAVVANAEWMRTIAVAAGNILSAKVKAFEPSQIEESRTWLSNAPESHHESGLTYTNNLENNIVEIVVEGKITAADFKTLIAKADTDFAKHGKLRILEDIRSFEGIDPMALWIDLQQIRRINDVTHVAIVVDVKWLRTIAEAMGGIYLFEMKVFERSQIEGARTWLASC